MVKLEWFKKSEFQTDGKFEFQWFKGVYKVGKGRVRIWTVTKFSRNNSSATCNDNPQRIVLEFVHAWNTIEIFNCILLAKGEKNDIRLVVSRYRVTFLMNFLNFEWMIFHAESVVGIRFVV